MMIDITEIVMMALNKFVYTKVSAAVAASEIEAPITTITQMQ